MAVLLSARGPLVAVRSACPFGHDVSVDAVSGSCPDAAFRKPLDAAPGRYAAPAAIPTTASPATAPAQVARRRRCAFRPASTATPTSIGGGGLLATITPCS